MRRSDLRCLAHRRWQGRRRRRRAFRDREAILAASGELNDYYLMWSAKAELLRRTGNFPAGASAYRCALQVVTRNPDRRFLTRRLKEVESGQA